MSHARKTSEKSRTAGLRAFGCTRRAQNEVPFPSSEAGKTMKDLLWGSTCHWGCCWRLPQCCHAQKEVCTASCQEITCRASQRDYAYLRSCTPAACSRACPQPRVSVSDTTATEKQHMRIVSDATPDASFPTTLHQPGGANDQQVSRYAQGVQARQSAAIMDGRLSSDLPETQLDSSQRARIARGTQWIGAKGLGTQVEGIS